MVDKMPNKKNISLSAILVDEGLPLNWINYPNKKPSNRNRNQPILPGFEQIKTWKLLGSAQKFPRSDATWHFTEKFKKCFIKKTINHEKHFLSSIEKCHSSNFHLAIHGNEHVGNGTNCND